MIEKDILIVGAGPVGLFAAFNLGLLGMNSVIIDSQDTIGGQLTSLYPEKYIYDIPGYHKILAKDLITELHKQAMRYNPEIILSTAVTTVTKDGDYFIVSSNTEVKVKVKAIIIASGAGECKPNRPNINNIQDYENESVFYSVQDPKYFEGKNILISGGGDSALDWAVILAEKYAKKVYISHRRDRFRAMPSQVELLKQKAAENPDKVEFLIPYLPSEIITQDNKMSSMKLLHTKDNSIKTIEIDYFIAFFGLSRNINFLKLWGLDIIDNMYVNVDNNNNYETKVKGIFAVGDIATYPNKLKLIMTGFSEVAHVSHAAFSYVFPGQYLKATHSTSSIKE